MSIFDDIDRQDAGPHPADEAPFSYLNRSGRTEAERVRRKVDEWFAAYPETHRNGLVARFRSTIDAQHQSAFFELFLYHFLLARGCKVIEIEPKLEHTDKSPDFLVENEKQERFYLEAVQASGLSNQEVAAQARLNMALRAIDDISSPVHFLDLKVTGSPAKPLSINKIRTAVKSWIAGLPKDETARQAAPFIHEEHGVTIRLAAWPRKKPDTNGKAIGVRWSPVVRADPSQEILPALKGKVSRYGKLELPYLVALNGLSLLHNENAVHDALFGKDVIRISTGPDGQEVVEQLRQPNGLWYGPPDGQPRNTRLSGVLALNRVDPWNFASKKGVLIANPWTNKPLPQIGLGTDELFVVDDKFERKTGAQMHELLGMPATWPE